MKDEVSLHFKFSQSKQAKCFSNMKVGCYNKRTQAEKYLRRGRQLKEE